MQATAEHLFAWAQAAFAVIGLQVWVSDDLGLHPRALVGAAPEGPDRDLARQCCIAGQPMARGNCLAVPIALSDRCSGACLFVLQTLPDLQKAGVFSARVGAVAYRLDTSIQTQRVERLSGLARKSHLLRRTLAIAHALEQCERLEPAFALLHESLRSQMVVDNFFVAVLDEAGENLIFEYYVDKYESHLPMIPMHEGMLQGSLTAFVVSSGRVLRGSSRELLQQSGHIDQADSYGYGSDSYDWLGVPMMVGSTAMGALVVQSYDPEVTLAEEDPSTLTMVAEAMAAALMRRRVRETLQRTVRERTLQLEQANTALQETVIRLERARSELVQAEKLASLGSMVAGISHELNTPIGNALTVSTALQDSFARLAEQVMDKGLTRSSLDNFLSSGREMTDMVVRSTHRAAALIADFKQVALDQTSAQRRLFDLHQVTESILIASGHTAGRSVIRIDNTVPPDVLCDSFPGSLGQVLANLIQNALMHAFFGRAQGLITIDAELFGESAGRRVRLTVADDGVGMPAPVLAHAFDPFFTTRLGQGGSGLGLAVCHRIVTSVLGGVLSVTSQVGHGARFVLEFPVSAPHQT